MIVWIIVLDLYKDLSEISRQVSGPLVKTTVAEIILDEVQLVLRQRKVGLCECMFLILNCTLSELHN